MTTNLESAPLTDEQWQQYDRDGFLRLGKLMPDAELLGLQDRIDAIMLGEADVPYERMMMQQGTPDGDAAGIGPQSKGFKGPTLNYRKIEGLELDPAFHRYMSRPLFRHIAARVYGAGTDVGIFRAMFMNKPAGYGTPLIWHQDRWTTLDRDPLVTIYTALDAARQNNGCVSIIPGSHRRLVNPEHGSGFLSAEQAEEIAASDQALPLELDAGEVVLLHNWTLHSSAGNTSDRSRRAFSFCLMEAETRHRETGQLQNRHVLYHGAEYKELVT
jgi:phytanoyl-CoA hydroxylase